MIFRLRHMMRKLKLGKRPIRVVFLASEPHGWFSLHSVYRACEADPLFEVSVINIGFGRGDADSWLGLAGDCATLFQQHGIEFLDGISVPVSLERLSPDIIVTESPYDQFRPTRYRTPELLRCGKLVYIPYGADFADRTGNMGQQTFGYETQKNAWRIFSRSPRTVTQYGRYGQVPAYRVVSLGLPIFDLYHSDFTKHAHNAFPDEVRSASSGKFKVLYTPHHTLDGWSTFLRYGPHIRRLLQENNDWYLVFRPHPGLGPALQHSGVMSDQAFRTFFSGERCHLYEGDDYYGAFHWSDVLISDASSFLLQYAPSRKPVIYLHREDGWDLDDTVREDVFNSYYVACSEHQITEYLVQLRNGVDPLADTRHRCQKRMSVGMFTADAGPRIAAYLRDLLA